MSEGEEATSHAPRQNTEGVGSEANRTQLSGSTYLATDALATEPSTVMPVGGDRGRGCDGQHPPSGPGCDEQHPRSGPGCDGQHPPSGSGCDRRPPPSNTRYDGHPPPSGPGCGGQGPPFGPGYDSYHPQFRPNYDSHHMTGYYKLHQPSGPLYYGHHPSFGSQFNWHHPASEMEYQGRPPPSGRGYQGHPPACGPEYDGHYPHSGPVMTRTVQQHMCLDPIHSAHKQTPPSQTSTLHPGPSAAPSHGRQEAGYHQALRPSHEIMPANGMGQYGHGSSPGYGTQSSTPEGPSLSKPLPRQTGCLETSTPSSKYDAEQVCTEDEFRVLVENASSSTEADCIQIFLEAKTELTVESVLPGTRVGTFLVTFKEKPDIGQLKSCLQKRRIEDSWLKVSHVLQSDCVKVTSLSPYTTDDSIKFYFMNRRKSDGGDVRTVTRSPDSTGAIVCFCDPEVARRVCSRAHKLNMKNVVVTYHHELLETWGSTSPGNTGTHPPSGPGYDGQHPPSGPGCDRRPPPSNKAVRDNLGIASQS